MYNQKNRAGQPVHQTSIWVVPRGVSGLTREYVIENVPENTSEVLISEGVDCIGDGAFSDYLQLKKVVITADLRRIGRGAFLGCLRLSTISIFGRVEEIGESILRGCIALQAIGIPESHRWVIPEGVESLSEAYMQSNVPDGTLAIVVPAGVRRIGEGVFKNRNNLLEISILGEIAEMAQGEIKGCDDLKIVNVSAGHRWVIPSGVGYLTKEYVEANMPKGTLSVVVPESVTGIGGEAFKDCNHLIAITLSERTLRFAQGILRGCDNLAVVNIPESRYWYIPEGRCYLAREDVEANMPEGTLFVVIPKTVKQIGDGAFYSCNGLIRVCIAGVVDSIGDDGLTLGGRYGAFMNCGNLISMVLPYGVESVSDRAFQGCTSLTTITISETVTRLGSDVFSGCISLKTVNIGEDHCWRIPAGVELSKAYVNLHMPRWTLSVIIPEGVRNIEDGAFCGCNRLTSVVIPQGVTCIGGGAFQDCASLTAIVIPEGVLRIGRSAFQGCNSMTVVKLPESIELIDSEAFLDCINLSEVTISDGVRQIGENVFGGCDHLRVINMSETHRWHIPGSVENLTREYLVSRVPLVTLAVIISEGVKCIGSEAFGKSESLTLGSESDDLHVFSNLRAIVIPKGVTSIKEEAFCHCTSMVEIVLPSELKEIEDYAFEDCASLTMITIPETVSDMGSGVFSGCGNLRLIFLPDQFCSEAEKDRIGIQNGACYGYGDIRKLLSDALHLSGGYEMRNQVELFRLCIDDRYSLCDFSKLGHCAFLDVLKAIQYRHDLLASESDAMVFLTALFGRSRANQVEAIDLSIMGFFRVPGATMYQSSAMLAYMTITDVKSCFAVKSTLNGFSFFQREGGTMGFCDRLISGY